MITIIICTYNREKYIRPLNAARKGEMTVNVGDLWNDYRNGYYR